jgi:hypothetical protein
MAGILAGDGIGLKVRPNAAQGNREPNRDIEKSWPESVAVFRQGRSLTQEALLANNLAAIVREVP